MKVLGVSTGARYSAKVFRLKELEAEHSKGLDAITQTIYKAAAESSDPENLAKAVKARTGVSLNCDRLTGAQRNACLATLVRDVCEEHGWLEAYSCLLEAAPACGLQKKLLCGVATCAKVYDRIKVAERLDGPVDVRMKVVKRQNSDSMFEIGPKGMGGDAWEEDDDYEELMDRWTADGFADLPPIVTCGFNGMNKKIVARSDEKIATVLSMLGTLKYDLDQDPDNEDGFSKIMKSASSNVLAAGKPIQSGAIAAMLNFDLQSFARSQQIEWQDEEKGPYVLGLEDISPKDWVTAQVMDASVLLGLGYEEPERHPLSTKGTFVGTLLSNSYDTLYDIGANSRFSSGLYACASGVPRQDIHFATAGFVIGVLDAIAQRILDLSQDEIPLVGDAVAVHAGTWSAFNGRYRTWERFIKYTRQLEESDSSEAEEILDAAKECLVLADNNIEGDVVDSWSAALTFSPACKLSERKTKAYTVLPSSEMPSLPGVRLPDICPSCKKEFKDAIMEANDKVQAIPGLPENVVESPAVSLAAAIRRTAVWAASDDCCDVCASRIGAWADNASSRVLVRIMMNEPEMTAKEWLLQSYFIACVTFCPVSVPSILQGFDLVADVRFEEGAVPEREVD